MTDHEYGFDTLCLHAGQQPDPVSGARAVPLHQTTSFVFDSTDHAASLFNLQTFGNIYGRMTNPTTAVFEERMAALEGGRAAVAAASGMGAQTAALLTLLSAGDEVVASRTLYGGTYSQLDVTLRRLGIETTFVDGDDPAAFAAAITPRTKVVYAETLGNPVGNVLDIEGVASVAHGAGLPLIVDNTMATPYLCRPMDYGADIVVHSATKFIGGHGTAIGGVVVESGRFPWDNGNFPGMTEASAGYHGVRFYETFGDFGFTMKVRCETLRTLGPTLAPMHAWLFLQGLETLPLRMERHCSNAQRVAAYLEGHSAVSWVQYAGLESSPYADRRGYYLPNGAGGIVSFGIRGGHEAGVRFIESVAFLSHLANIGDAKSLVIHPASTTHRQLDEAQQISAGVPPDMIRLSVGLESIDDILWDIDQALASAVE